MDSNTIKNFTIECMQDHKPGCELRCPLQVDIKSFLNKVKKLDFNGAYKLLRNRVIFPAIVCELCSKPCESTCVREKYDEPVSIRKIEKECVRLAKNKSPIKYNVPKKKGRIVIVGAGLSGLSCAYKLASKNYEVVVYEKEDGTGGSMRSLQEFESIFMPELEWQMQSVSYTLRINSEVNDLNSIEYDAVYIATGAEGNDFGLKESAVKSTLASHINGVFIGGGILGASPENAVENGVRAADSIEKYLKTGSMSGYPKDESEFFCSFEVSLKGVSKLASFLKAENEYESSFSEEDVACEADRCLQCKCEACKSACTILDYYNKMPKKLSSDLIATLYPINTLSARIVTRLTELCNDCGACHEACPIDINLGRLLMDARRKLHNDGVISPSFHEYWIKDMNHSFGENSFLLSHAPGESESKYLFFPGCQLGASNPEYVTKSYDYLLETLPLTGIMLSCCGAPAHWAGDDLLYQNISDTIMKKWTEMGRPIIITACSSCEKLFSSNLPEIETKSLFTVIAESGIPDGHVCLDEKLSIFDPCSSRENSEIREAIRKIAGQSGYEVEEIYGEGDVIQCCGYGGNIYAAHPDYFSSLVERRGSMSSNTYITYCSNCHDSFSYADKKNYHILDLLFDIGDASDKPPSLSDRRTNRERLKFDLCDNKKLFHLSSFAHDFSESAFDLNKNGSATEHLPQDNLVILDATLQYMDKKLIIRDDIIDTVGYCERTGEKILNEKTGYSIGHLKKDSTTYWLVYEIKDNEVVIHNLYSHRLTIAT